MKNVKVNWKQVIMWVCALALLGFFVTGIFKAGYEFGRDYGRQETVTAVDQFLNEYNTYLVEDSGDRDWQMGSGLGPIKVDKLYSGKDMFYSYDCPKLTFEYAKFEDN